MQLALEELLRGPVSKITPEHSPDDTSTLERPKAHWHLLSSVAQNPSPANLDELSVW